MGAEVCRKYDISSELRQAELPWRDSTITSFAQCHSPSAEPEDIAIEVM